MEKKSKHVTLAQQNGFGPTFFSQKIELHKRHSKAQ
jgi:hypothetical protein